MKIRVARIICPVHSLGGGDRIAIWLQGCSVAEGGDPCAQCISPEYWDSGQGALYDTVELSRIIMDGVATNGLTGISVSGGEPTDQSDALCDVYDRCAAGARFGDVDWLLFSYHSPSRFMRKFPALYSRFDAFVLGKYSYRLPCAEPLLASSNQRLVLRSELAKTRHGDLRGMPRIEAFMAGGDGAAVEFVGVPRKGDMQMIESRLAANGIRASRNAQGGTE